MPRRQTRARCHSSPRFVSTNDAARFHWRNLTIAPALVREQLGPEEIAHGRWEPNVYDYPLVYLDEREGHICGVHGQATFISSGT